MSEAAANPCPDGKFPRADAETFVRVILKFLEAHAALESNQVVIVGKSYGGYRALHILDLLLHHEELRAEHPDLSEEIAQHFRRLEPEQEGPFGPRDVARQFGNLAMIQGSILFSNPFLSCEAAPEGVDPYRIDKPAGWDDSLVLRAANLWSKEVESSSLLGVPLDSVVGLTGPERGPAFRLPPTEIGNVGQSIVADALAETFGELPQGDSYFGAFPLNEMFSTFDSDARDPVVTVVPYVRVFATNALLDRKVCQDPFLQLYQLSLDNAPRPGQARPGRVVLGAGSSCLREMRVPTYEHSGHDVPAAQPRELAEDLEQWLHGN